MLKRSKSKETGVQGGGSQTQRLNATGKQDDSTAQSRHAIGNSSGIQNGQRNANLLNAGNSASKSIFNASFKELKPSKSVDLTASMAENANMGAEHADDPHDNIEFYLFKPSEKVVQVACGSIHSLIRTNMHRIFSCGNGSTFALGHSSRESCSTFRLVEFFNGATASSPSQAQSTGDQASAGLNNVSIKTIACGLSHSGCVTGDGQVYLWGLTGEVSGKANQDKLLDKCLFKKPTHISFRHCLERDPQGSSQQQRRKSGADGAPQDSQTSSAAIEDLKMGEYFSMALSTRGYVYTWGMNDKGQLGINSDAPYSFEPVAVSSSKSTLSKASQKIDCGLKHCLVLTKDFQLYSWGSNQLCQLGRKLPQTGKNFAP